MAEQTVSIIIPVYNSAPYLPACLDSVLAQTYRNTEILIIENGSTDESPRICQQYADKDSRVRLITGPHTGPGAARNLGIREAKGRYILFADSDDICEPDLARTLLDSGADKRFTLTLCGIRIIDDVGKETGAFQEVYRSCQIKKYLSDILADWKTNPLCGGVYCKLYSARILKDNNILFDEHSTYAEDFCFNMEYLRYVKDVTILPDLLYRYRIGHPGSLTEKNLQDSDFAALWQRRLEVCKVYEDLYSFYELTQRCQPDIDAFFWFQMADMLQLSARRAPGYSEFHMNMKTLRTNRPDHGKLTGIPQKDFLSLRLLLLHMDWPLWLYERGRRRLRILRNRER